MTDPIPMVRWRGRHARTILRQLPGVQLWRLPSWANRGGWCYSELDLAIRERIVEVVLRRVNQRR